MANTRHKLFRGLSLVSQVIIMAGLFGAVTQLNPSELNTTNQILLFGLFGVFVVLYGEAKLSYYRLMTDLENAMYQLGQLETELKTISQAVTQINTMSNRIDANSTANIGSESDISVDAEGNTESTDDRRAELIAEIREKLDDLDSDLDQQETRDRDELVHEIQSKLDTLESNVEDTENNSETVGE